MFSPPPDPPTPTYDATARRRPKGYVVPDPVNEPLYVVTTLFNPLRWKSRWKHFERFAQHVIDSGAVLYTIEVAFGEREPATDYAAQHGSRAFTDFREDMIQANRWWCVRTDQEIWYKENAINRMVSRLPDSWKYVAWVDADVHWLSPKWVGETIQQLQHYKFLQMFSYAHDLNPQYEIMGQRPSFMRAYMDGTLEKLRGKDYGYYYYGKKGLGAWSGLAWAARREAWDEVGGLLDCCVTGAADWYMAWALVSKEPGDVLRVIPKGSHPNFTQRILDWEMLCIRNIRRDVGVMSGSIAHMFHGRKADRKYVDRSKLLATWQFDPIKDLRYDWQGLIQLNDDGSRRFIEIRDEIRKWARERNEDINEI
jgi:hypothetical protein